MRILWLKTELLHPVDKGGKIRTYHMLKELKRDHHVTYLALDDGSAASDAADRSSEYAHELIRIPHKTAIKFSPRFYAELGGNFVSSLPYALQKYCSAAFRERLESLVSSGGFDLLVCDFLAPAVNVPDGTKIPTLLFQHNVEALIWRRHSEVATNPAKKWFFRSQWNKMAAFEAQACRRFDRVVAVSKEDADLMKREYGVSTVSDVPTGVDTDFFRPKEYTERTNNIVFTGSMDWLPNEDAIRWFVDAIFPLIRYKVPDAVLTVVGRNPAASLQELASADSGVVVTGRVPDVRPYMNKASVYVVPIRIGGGTRLKIYEAMAMGLPIVSTTIGAEGLSVKDGQNILLRDDPEAFAKAVVHLLADAKAASAIGKASAQHVVENFSWVEVARAFTRQCENVIENTKRAAIPLNT
jgi:sugar transferase (PEP-CTERM/EpsH1 system associated)